MKWTHKIVYRDGEDWWHASLSDGVIYFSVQAGKHCPSPVRTEAKTVEEYYNYPKYSIEKLQQFKGNL